MAEAADDGGDPNAAGCSDPQKRPHKRRRIIAPSAIRTVPVYSNKVNCSLNLNPVTFQKPTLQDEEKAEPLWPASPPRATTSKVIALSDSEEEPEQHQTQEVLFSPSPPPPCPPVRQSRRANKKIQEINRKLDAIGSLVCLSPEHEPIIQNLNSTMDDFDDDSDIIIIPSSTKSHSANTQDREFAREISLKFRCRTEVVKIPILSTAPLSKAVEQLAVKLDVPADQILLLKKDIDLPVHSTVSDLGLGIADIIDCVVTEKSKQEERQSDVITVRFQGKEKSSVQEYSLQKDAPLGSILTQYVASLAASSKRKARFFFDGSRVTHDQTPAQLDMEDGDIIEVWA